MKTFFVCFTYLDYKILLFSGKGIFGSKNTKVPYHTHDPDANVKVDISLNVIYFNIFKTESTIQKGHVSLIEKIYIQD